MRKRVGCVVLAAGASTRLGDGTAKQLLHFAGKPLLQYAIDAATSSRASSCTLVLGAHAQAIMDVVNTRRCAVIENWHWQEGIASSVRAGVGAHTDDDACILMVADQPFVTATDLNNIITRSAFKPRAIVVLQRDSVWGTPALFPRADFLELSKLRGDSGAKSYIAHNMQRLVFVDARSPQAFTDVDTPGDREHLRQYEPSN